MQYELFYLVGQNNEEKMGEIKTEIEKILSDESAKIHQIEVINKRKLSYEIKHQIRGTYVARRFDLPENDYWAEEPESKGNDSLQRITAKINLMPNVLRFIIVKADELPELKQKEAASPKKEVERKEKPFNKKPAMAPEKKEEKKEEESIDKKLEEILNI